MEVKERAISNCGYSDNVVVVLSFNVAFIE